jgi:uncharacterized protein
MTRVVLDTSVVVSAVISSGGPNARFFDLITEGHIVPCISEPVLAEYHRVFSYDRPRHLDARRISPLLGLLKAVSIRVRPRRVLKVSSHDDDNRIYECAAAAGASYIVTENTRHFKEPYKATQIVNARQLLALIQAGGE